MLEICYSLGPFEHFYEFCTELYFDRQVLLDTSFDSVVGTSYVVVAHFIFNLSFVVTKLAVRSIVMSFHSSYFDSTKMEMQ